MRDEDSRLERGIVCKQILKKGKITNWKERSKTRADWEKSIKEAKARIGLWCHLGREEKEVS
jgi:hypothetical protein